MERKKKEGKEVRANKQDFPRETRENVELYREKSGEK